MHRLTRRVLAFVSIVGGGLLGAAPTAVAAPSDPTPNPSAAETTGATPSPAPAPDPSVRTGRAPAPGDRTGASPSTPSAPAEAPSVAVRTGRATDLTPQDPSGPASTLAAPPSSPDPSPGPAAPTPSPARVGTANAATAAAAGGSNGAAKPPPGSVAAGPPPPGPDTHVTVGGDDLWGIAAAHLAQLTGRPVASMSAAEVATYWQRVCDLNRPHLQSGDPNLIYPGEEIELPAISG